MNFARSGLIVAAIPLFVLAQSGEGTRIAGTWRGESLCAQKESACRDETVVYRFAELPQKPGYFSVSADKIVGGSAVNMGALAFQYIEDRHVLVCEYSQGVWRLKVDGSRMEGTLTRPDGTVFRNTTLRKESESGK